jgi:hypothetical protein
VLWWWIHCLVVVDVVVRHARLAPSRRRDLSVTTGIGSVETGMRTGRGPRGNVQN